MRWQIINMHYMVKTQWSLGREFISLPTHLYIFFLFTRHNNLLAGSVRSSTESRSNTAKYNTVCRILSSRQFCPYTRGFHHWHMYHDNHRTIPVPSTDKATQKNMDNRSHESTEAHINTKTIHCTNLFVCIIYRVYCSNSCFLDLESVCDPFENAILMWLIWILIRTL